MRERMMGKGRVVDAGLTGMEPYDMTVEDGRAGNAEAYAAGRCTPREHSPLAGKTLCWLGSSVTYGFAARGEAVPDYMAMRDGTVCWKSGISGTTLADIPFGPEADNPWRARVNEETPEALCREMAKLSYLRRLADFPRDVRPDLFILQLSTNDAQFPMRYQGKIAGGFEPEAFDTGTTFGTMEAILCRVRRDWSCPVLVYSSPLLSTEAYSAMVRTARAICRKWGAHLLDLNADAAFNALGRAHMEDWMADEVHPLRRGYLEWWTPAFESAIEKILCPGEGE